MKIRTISEIFIVQLERFNRVTNIKNRRLVKISMKYDKEMKLVAVVEHNRTARSGHYSAKCCNHAINNMYLMDDQFVKKIEEERI